MANRKRIIPPPSVNPVSELGRFYAQVCEYINKERHGEETTSDYALFEDDGTLVFNGAATVWRDELGQLIGQRLESPASDIVQNNAEGSLTYKTSATTADYVIINIQINHDWKFGSDIKPHLHWFQASATMPHWLIQYRWQKNGSAKTTAWTNQKWAANAFTYSAGTLNQITGFGSIAAPAGYSISDILQIRLIRDTANASTLFTGADALAASVEAVSFDVHREIDTVGSRQEYVK